MRFLRKRGEAVEQIIITKRYTATQKAQAMDILHGQVIIARHPYDRLPSSDVGNCWCGRSEFSSLHHIILEGV